MPETTQLNIEIDANGGSAAAAEVKKVTMSFEEMNLTHEAMKAKFAQRFEHVGVHLFGHDLLNMMGIAGGARPILSLLRFSVMEAAETMGIAAGSIGLWVFGLTAAVAIIAKIVESHNKHAESLHKLIQEQEAGVKATNELQDAFDHYDDSVGKAGGSLGALEAATKTLGAAQKDLLATTLQLELEALAKTSDEAGGHFNRLAASAAASGYNLEKFGLSTNGSKELTLEMQEALGKASVAMETAGARAKEITAELDRYRATGDLIASKDFMKGQADSADRAAKAVEKVSDIMAKNAEESEKAGQSFYDFSTKMAEKLNNVEEQAGTSKQAAITRTYDKMREEVDREFAHEQQKLLEGRMTNVQYYQALGQLHAQHEALKTAITNTENAKREDSYRAFFGAARSQQEIMLTGAKDVFNKMAGEWSKNITGMIFDGTKWRQNFQDVMKEIGKAFFEAVLQMEIRWLAFKAMTGMGFFGGGSALAGMPGFAAADGFSGVVSGPTVFLAGESGAESVNITPMSRMPSGGNAPGGGQSIVVGDIHVHGVQDPKRFADMVGQEIVKAIRGRGQLAFTRAA